MQESTSIRLFNPQQIHKPNGYSHVAEITRGKLVYLSGQVAMDQAGNLVGANNFGEQVRQIFANLNAALEAVGASFKNVVKLNSYCVDTVDPSEMAAFRSVRDTYVDTENPPASTFVVVRRLVRPEWLIEIEAVAVV